MKVTEEFSVFVIGNILGTIKVVVARMTKKQGVPTTLRYETLTQVINQQLHNKTWRRHQKGICIIFALKEAMIYIL